MSVKIKICGLSTPETVEAAISAGATHIGLVFHPQSPRNVTVELASRLAQQASRTAKVVGLFVNPDSKLLDAVRSKVSLDVIQLHGSETPAVSGRIRIRHGLEIWKALSIGSAEDVSSARKYLGTADRILYDAKPPVGSAQRGGMGTAFDWSLLDGHEHPLPWVLAGGLDPRNVREAISRTGADFVDVSSGVESAPGVKDVDLIRAFCEAARRP